MRFAGRIGGGSDQVLAAVDGLVDPGDRIELAAQADADGQRPGGNAEAILAAAGFRLDEVVGRIRRPCPATR